MIVFGCTDFDYAMRFDRPVDLNKTNNQNKQMVLEVKFETIFILLLKMI